MTEDTVPQGRSRGLDASDTEVLQALLMDFVASIHQHPEAELTNTFTDLYTEVSKLIVRQKYADGVILGEDIYNDVSKFLVGHLQPVATKLQSQDGFDVILAYLAEWDQYTSSITKIDRILNLLNQHYLVKKTGEEQQKGFYPTHDLHFAQWRSEVWENICDHVIDCFQRVADEYGIPTRRDQTPLPDVEKFMREINEIAAKVGILENLVSGETLT